MKEIAKGMASAFVGAWAGLFAAGIALYLGFTHQHDINAYLKDVMFPPRAEKVVDLLGLEMKLVQNLAACLPENNACLAYAILRYNKERDPIVAQRYETEARINLFSLVLNEAARDVQGQAAIARAYKKDSAEPLVELLTSIRKTQQNLSRASMLTVR